MTDGRELVRVATASNQAEAEMIQNILLEEGIPSILRRTRGFDVPDFLAAGPRDVVVQRAAYERARELLFKAGLVTTNGAGPPPPPVGSPLRLFGGVLVAVTLAGLLVWVLDRVSG